MLHATRCPVNPSRTWGSVRIVVEFEERERAYAPLKLIRHQKEVHPMARVKALTDRTIAERFAEIKTDEQLWGEISTETRQLAQRILESALEDELQYRLQAGRYKRT